jgi:hypothetical protein
LSFLNQKLKSISIVQSLNKDIFCQIIFLLKTGVANGVKLLSHKCFF